MPQMGRCRTVYILVSAMCLPQSSCGCRIRRMEFGVGRLYELVRQDRPAVADCDLRLIRASHGSDALWLVAMASQASICSSIQTFQAQTDLFTPTPHITLYSYTYITNASYTHIKSTVHSVEAGHKFRGSKSSNNHLHRPARRPPYRHPLLGW